MEVLTQVSYYVSKLYWIEDCEESDERERSVLKHISDNYRALSVRTKKSSAYQAMCYWRSKAVGQYNNPNSNHRDSYRGKLLCVMNKGQGVCQSTQATNIAHSEQ